MTTKHIASGFQYWLAYMAGFTDIELLNDPDWDYSPFINTNTNINTNPNIDNNYINDDDDDPS